MNALVMFKALLLAGLALVAGTTLAQGVRISNTESSAVPVIPGSNSTAFTIPPTVASLSPQGSPTQTGDPPGTRYAITSLIATNASTLQAQTVKMEVKSGSVSGSCQLIFNVVDTKPGPIAVVPAGATVHLSYTQPFITEATTSGSTVCLVASGNPTAYVGLSWSAVGYKILP